MTKCVHCQRDIELVEGVWIDPLATGDDSVWRDVCDSHDSFYVGHEWHSTGDHQPGSS